MCWHPRIEWARRFGLAITLAAGVPMAPAVAQSTPPPMLRAAVPPEIRPGLAIVLDTSAGAAAPLATPAPYDPHTDYGARS